MASFEDIVRYNAQTSGREKLIRICQYSTKMLHATCLRYYSTMDKIENEDLLTRLKELEQYFASCRRLMNFGRSFDHFYTAIRSIQLHDPIVRSTLFLSKISSSILMAADHVLWLHQMGFIKIDQQRWSRHMNQFWLYSVIMNLMRDLYEVILVAQSNSFSKSTIDTLIDFKLNTPIRWIKKYPKIACDFTKNLCDFFISYSALGKTNLSPMMVASLGLISSSMGIMQIYDQRFRLSPS